MQRSEHKIDTFCGCERGDDLKHDDGDCGSVSATKHTKHVRTRRYIFFKCTQIHFISSKNKVILFFFFSWHNLTLSVYVGSIFRAGQAIWIKITSALRDSFLGQERGFDSVTVGTVWISNVQMSSRHGLRYNSIDGTRLGWSASLSQLDRGDLSTESGLWQAGWSDQINYELHIDILVSKSVAKYIQNVWKKQFTWKM